MFRESFQVKKRTVLSESKQPINQTETKQPLKSINTINLNSKKPQWKTNNGENPNFIINHKRIHKEKNKKISPLSQNYRTAENRIIKGENSIILKNILYAPGGLFLIYGEHILKPIYSQLSKPFNIWAFFRSWRK